MQPLPPLTADALALHVARRPAIAPAPRRREIVLPAGLPEGATVRAWRQPGEGQVLHVGVEGPPVGLHHFPPPVPAVRPDPRRRPLGVDDDPDGASGHLPGHLARAPHPAPLPEELELGNWHVPGSRHASGPVPDDAPAPPRRATARPAAGGHGSREPASGEPAPGAPESGGPVREVVGSGATGPAPQEPSASVVFADTSYPWSATGRVDVPGGWGSGVLVGPRHLLTAAHIIPWVTGGGGVSAAGWVRFTPGAFDASEPFGSASAVAVYCLQPTYPPSIDGEEERVDFAVCVLDRDIGRLTGWMGVQAYRDEWDDLPSWSHVGYRGEHATGTRPSHQWGLALDGHDSQADTHQSMFHRGDVHPGQSGGPFFGWWAGEDCPRVVAVQSWGLPGRAGASGGAHLVDLVIRARRDHR